LLDQTGLAVADADGILCTAIQIDSHGAVVLLSGFSDPYEQLRLLMNETSFHATNSLARALPGRIRNGLLDLVASPFCLVDLSTII
jgi:hypothetical protein